MFAITPIPAFNDNYIWMISRPGSGQTWVVDPGDAHAVLKTLDNQHLKLAGILITHHHYDHTGGIEKLCARYPVPVYGPDNPAIQGITHPLRDKDSFDLEGIPFSVIATPGHTLDHIAYYIRETETSSPALFCGDTLFAGGCGRLFEGTPEQMHASLSRLSQLPGNTRVFCAHEYTLANLEFALAVDPDNIFLQKRLNETAILRKRQSPTVPSTLDTELQTNPFLRCHIPTIIHAAEERGASKSDSCADILRVIREWKDNF